MIMWTDSLRLALRCFHPTATVYEWNGERAHMAFHFFHSPEQLLETMYSNINSLKSIQLEHFTFFASDSQHPKQKYMKTE